jgi:asparagine synthase (glutamine-hydrolysing)
MCGLVGYINSTKINQDSLNSMLSSIKHRGPDGDGIFKNDFFSLGHARLSLVDLERGSQPMMFKQYTIVFNGEIYNHKELRDSLIEKGYSFDTNSDTEVVLKAFDFYNFKFIDYFNGIFSICIVNNHTKEMILARDYFGVKPLHYYYFDNIFVFSSEQKAIFKFLKHNKIEYNFNSDAIKEFLVYGYIANNKIIENIYEVDCGSVIQISNNSILNVHKIDLNSISKSNLDLKKLLKNQISKELDADVEIGVLLSGGIDSSLITALASEAKNNIKTFSIGYRESSRYDESPYARIVANKFNTIHYEYLFTQKNLLNQIPSLIDCMDQPVYDPAMLPMLFLSEKVKNEVKAVLSGDGGDELFGGYLHYRLFQYRWLYVFILRFERFLKHIFPKIKLLKNLINYVGVSKGPFFNSTNKLYNYSILPHREFVNFRNLMRYDIDNELRYKLLVKTDLTSMYKGLEVRVPFLNLFVYLKSLSLDSNELINILKGKVILRKILSEYLPNSIVNKKKVGFRVPLLEWISTGELGDQIELELLNNLKIPSNVISKGSIIEILSERENGKYIDEIFSLYILNKWLIKNS